ncbi:MAG: HNH endonuclease [Ilumatobacteraceae bacterium]
METSGVLEAVEALAGTIVSVADHGELADASRAVARVQAFVDLAKVQIARRGRELAEQGDSSSAHVLLDEGRCTGAESRAAKEREQVCGRMPSFEEALASGDVTAAHLDSLAQHSKHLTTEEQADLAEQVDELVAAAASQPASLFDRNVRNLVAGIQSRRRPGSDADELDRQRRESCVKRWTDRATGMKHTMLHLDPVRDASMWAIVDAELRRMCRDEANKQRPFGQMQVEAFIAAMTGSTSASGTDRVPEVVVHVDAGSLCHGRHDATLCETIDGVSLPVSTVQRMCCEALVQAVIVRPDGTVDRLCAERRTASRDQRRMLAAMYATCAHPHCEVGFSNCRIHHVEWWTNGGKTVMANLLPLCETHHHLVHEGGWHLSIDQARTVTWVNPAGSVWTVQPLVTSGRVGPSKGPP